MHRGLSSLPPKLIAGMVYGLEADHGDLAFNGALDDCVVPCTGIDAADADVLVYNTALARC